MRTVEDIERELREEMKIQEPVNFEELEVSNEDIAAQNLKAVKVLYNK